MTENERAIKDIQFLARRYDDLQEVNMSVSQESLDMAIQALEDMQKLKELGECYVIPKNGTFEINGINVHTAVEELEQYRAIGTVEELQKKMEELERWHTDRINDNIKNPFAYTSTSICHNCDHKDEYIEELESEVAEYESIGTIEDFKALKEKNTQNPHYCKCGGYISKYNGYRCTDCGALHAIID